MTWRRPALFLDRDGVIIDEVGYLGDPAQVRLIPGSGEAIARVNEHNIPVIVVTNQAGVARGYFPEARVAEVHAHLDALLAERGAHIDGYYHCPHHPTAGMGSYRCACTCRKPQPGLLLQAAADFGIDLARSCLVGDKRSDVEAARAANCDAILVRTGYGHTVCQDLGRHGLGTVAIADCLALAVHQCLPALMLARRAG